jgi:hypothetical protein
MRLRLSDDVRDAHILSIATCKDRICLLGTGSFLVTIRGQSLMHKARRWAEEVEDPNLKGNYEEETQ